MSTILTGEESHREILLKMANGNPGAVVGLIELLKIHDIRGLVAICTLDDLGIRGSDIWIGYKDYCKHDAHKFLELIIARDEEMISFIKRVR